MSLSFGQRIDSETDLIEPWFTHGALDKLKEMDLSDKIIWMWGAGMGDSWLAKRCKELHIVERTTLWMQSEQDLVKKNIVNLRYYYRPCNEGSGEQESYCRIPLLRPDVFIVDDAYRYECILKVLEYKPCLLIVDNWQQDYVFICPAAEEALKDYKGEYFIQADHKDHEGRPWQTAIWNIK